MPHMNIIEEDCIQHRHVRLRDGTVEQLLRWIPGSRDGVVCTSHFDHIDSPGPSTKCYNSDGSWMCGRNFQWDIVEFVNDIIGDLPPPALYVTPESCAARRNVRLRNDTVLVLDLFDQTAVAGYPVRARCPRSGIYFYFLQDGRAYAALAASDWDIMDFVETKEKTK